MSRRELSPAEKRAAANLSALYLARKEKTGLSQLTLALACGWQTQGTVSQYLLGKIPLNAEAVARFANYFDVTPADIYPELAETLGMSSSPIPRMAAPHPIASQDAQSLIDLIVDMDLRRSLNPDAINAVKTLLSSIDRPKPPQGGAGLIDTALDDLKKLAEPNARKPQKD